MDKEAFADYAVKSRLEVTLQEALDILDAEDGRSFEEKKDAMITHLRSSKEPELFEALADLAAADKLGQKIKDDFWAAGVVTCSDNHTVLRSVHDSDRDGYLQLQKEYSIMKSMLKEPVYCDMAWNEHLDPKALMLTITQDGKYVGYCGIKNTSQKPWEIAIEILPQWTRSGVGSIAIAGMLDAISARLGISEFRIRIDPSNQASQGLFEKLGAVPCGISEFLIHDPDALRQCEEENLHTIDDDLIALAAKFDVEPRHLLSHVLEYTLLWQ